MSPTVSPARLLHHVEALRTSSLATKVVLAMAAGLSVGVLLGPEVGVVPPRLRTTSLQILALPGEVFLALLQMVVVPLVFASIARGITEFGETSQLKSVGLRFLAYTLTTTTLAMVVGLFLGWVVDPGRAIDAAARTAEAARRTETVAVGAGASWIDTLLPKNPLRALVEGQMLEVVSFAAIVGVAGLSAPPESVDLLARIYKAVLDVSMTVVRGAMRLAPLAVFGLTLKAGAAGGASTLMGLLGYVACVVGGLLVMCGFYVSLAALLGRPPRSFVRQAGTVATMAFSTSSSAAVMPLTIRTAVAGLGVRERVARLVVPLGATVNMDGTALYQTVAVTFLASASGIDLGPGGILALALTILAASVGTPATPGIGLVVLASVMSTVGVPPGAVGLVFGVDRILDMLRTAVNVTSDLTACLWVDRTLARASVAPETKASAPTPPHDGSAPASQVPGPHGARPDASGGARRPTAGSEPPPMDPGDAPTGPEGS